jgi:hypothetical protein
VKSDSRRAICSTIAIVGLQQAVMRSAPSNHAGHVTPCIEATAIGVMAFPGIGTKDNLADKAGRVGTPRLMRHTQASYHL